MHASPPAERQAAALLTPALLRSWPLPVDEDGDKHSRGTVLVIGGSTRTPGAVMLSGLGALRSGAGRLQIATTDTTAVTIAGHVPEALVEGLATTAHGGIDARSAMGTLAPRVGDADVVLYGPGLEPTEDDEAVELLCGVLGATSPRALVVIDALGLVCLARVPGDELAPLSGRLVLTPNRDEVRQLAADLGACGGEADQDHEAAALAVADHIGAVVATHGLVGAPDGRSWTLSSGDVGLGTSGSGDVLAGLVAGAAARCGDAAQAACWGAHVHGAAGDRLASRLGRVGFLARELLDEAPAAIAAIAEGPTSDRPMPVDPTTSGVASDADAARRSP
jgi:ADP-dependent NAD(P)H-hydrate dehydratase